MFKWFEKYVENVVWHTYITRVWPSLDADVRKTTEVATRDILLKTSVPDVKVQLDEGARMPVRAHDTDAGADLFCIDGFTVPAHSSVEIDTGVHIQLPSWAKAELVSKSGLNVKACIQTEGLIDAGYSGPIRVRVYNHGDYDYEFNAGDKVTQLVITDVLYPTFTQVDEVVGGERGDGGFGSTGL